MRIMLLDTDPTGKVAEASRDVHALAYWSTQYDYGGNDQAVIFLGSVISMMLGDAAAYNLTQDRRYLGDPSVRSALTVAHLEGGKPGMVEAFKKQVLARAQDIQPQEAVVEVLDRMGDAFLNPQPPQRTSSEANIQ